MRTAGALAMQFFRADAHSWTKDDGTVVSEADWAVNDLLRTQLSGGRPDYGWLSEETEDGAERLTKPCLWVVDPIDGTRAFLKGDPHFCIAVALVVGTEPALAMVYNPATEEFFDAVRGEGARLNGQPIQTSERQALEDCRMLGDPPMFKHPAWPEPWPPMHIETRDSIAYRLALVASGAFDATLSLTPKQDWDLAAADLIVREAGGVISPHFGGRLAFNAAVPRHRSVMAAGRNLYAELFRRLGHLQLP